MYVEDYKALPIAGRKVTHEERLRRVPIFAVRDLRVILGDYVPDRNVFYCPGAARWNVHHDIEKMYHFNDGASGVRLAQIRTPKHRAAILFDSYNFRSGWGHGWAHGKGNVLFLDGHVKAYKVVENGWELTSLNDGSRPSMWPPD